MCSLLYSWLCINIYLGLYLWLGSLVFLFYNTLIIAYRQKHNRWCFSLNPILFCAYPRNRTAINTNLSYTLICFTGIHTLLDMHEIKRPVIFHATCLLKISIYFIKNKYRNLASVPARGFAPRFTRSQTGNITNKCLTARISISV